MYLQGFQPYAMPQPQFHPQHQPQAQPQPTPQGHFPSNQQVQYQPVPTGPIISQPSADPSKYYVKVKLQIIL